MKAVTFLYRLYQMTSAQKLLVLKGKYFFVSIFPSLHYPSFIDWLLTFGLLGFRVSVALIIYFSQGRVVWRVLSVALGNDITLSLINFKYLDLIKV